MNLWPDLPRRGEKELRWTKNEKGEISTDTAEIQKKKKKLWTIICQQIWEPRRNEQFSRDIPQKLNQE